MASSHINPNLYRIQFLSAEISICILYPRRSSLDFLSYIIFPSFHLNKETSRIYKKMNLNKRNSFQKVHWLILQETKELPGCKFMRKKCNSDSSTEDFFCFLLILLKVRCTCRLLKKVTRQNRKIWMMHEIRDVFVHERENDRVNR